MAYLLRIAVGLLLACVAILSSSAAAWAEPADSVTFRQTPPQTGDVATQTVATRMSMDVSVHLGQQLVHRDATRIERGQERIMNLTRVEDGRSLAAEVTYRRAEQLVANGTGEEQASRQPVAGKTYRVERRGETLWIADQDGGFPPIDEYEIVWQNMESFGKPNPLAAFLAERTVAVGQTLDLPAEAAAQLLAVGDDAVAVERFALVLQEVQESGERQHAVFRALVSSRTHGREQMGMHVEGKLTVDAGTCRVTSLDLAGPIGMTQTRENGLETYLVSGRGKIEVSLRGESGKPRVAAARR